MFEQVGMLFENSSRVCRDQVFDALFARERLGSTGLGHGIAIPHGRIKGLREAAGAFVRTRTPIPVRSARRQSGELIFVLLVPEKATDLHLLILSELAEMFSDTDARALPGRRTGCGGRPHPDYRMGTPCPKSASRSCLRTMSMRSNSRGFPVRREHPPYLDSSRSTTRHKD